MYSRECVPIGGKLDLRAIFVDHCNEPLNVAEIVVTVVSANGVTAGTFSLSGQTVVEVAPGMYEIEFNVPGDINAFDEGTWVDTWNVYTDIFQDPVITEELSFQVMQSGKIVHQTISENSLIVALLGPDIKDIEGRPLNEEIQIAFSTRYNPYYASPDLLRAEVGTWLDSIPDDTLSLMIHWSSKEADLITPFGARNNPNYRIAVTKFVIFDVALRCLTLPVAGAGKGTKRLGDLMVQKNLDFKDAISDLKKKREEWFRVVNSRGRITPGQGFAPSVALKGQFHPENRKVGRLWWDPFEYPYAQPMGNRKIRKANQRKFRKGQVDIIDGRYFPPDEEPD